MPEENSAPEVSQPIAEAPETPKNDGWDFLKNLQVFGGCVSDSSDMGAHPFVDGFLEATTRYYEYEEKLELLYPVKIIVYHYTDNETAYDLPRSTKLLNEEEFKAFESFLKETELKYRLLTESVSVYSEGNDTEPNSLEYNIVHTELSADDMNELVNLGKEKGFHLNILFCESDSCLEGKSIYYPDGCVWHDCYEGMGKEIPENCFNKKKG